MNTAARDAAGIEPIREEMDRIGVISTLDDLTRFMARMPGIDGLLFRAGFGPFTDLADSGSYAIYAVAGDFGMDGHHEDLSDDPPAARGARPTGITCRTCLASPATMPMRRGAWPTSPSASNPVNIYNPVSIEEIQAQIPEPDPDKCFATLGYPVPERVILTEPGYFPVLSRMLRDRPLQDFRDHSTLRLILEFQNVLNARENMADMGGITFAWEALSHHLAEHPEENVEIDGLTPAQRRFISRSRMWAGKATDQFIRAIVATDGHPPMSCRAIASLQHVDAFYDAFGIAQGDPVWLATGRPGPGLVTGGLDARHVESLNERQLLNPIVPPHQPLKKRRKGLPVFE